ncbi:NUDIX hydrolase domain-like protein [Phellopilus nigrolimitatus]|nr:NUDIX hydrolase domain-like protein [Phellopilus nigrolimitatus]
MSKKRTTPRIVCCAIPISKATGKVLIVTSRKRPDNWVLPKGGWETSDKTLEAAASREALEEAGVHGTITKYVTTINGATATEWLERGERRREWVDFAEAVRRLQWKPELSQGLMLSSLAPRR